MVLFVIPYAKNMYIKTQNRNGCIPKDFFDLGV
jgi:hypothetical protein